MIFDIASWFFKHRLFGTTFRPWSVSILGIYIALLIKIPEFFGPLTLQLLGVCFLFLVLYQVTFWLAHRYSRYILLLSFLAAALTMHYAFDHQLYWLYIVMLLLIASIAAWPLYVIVTYIYHYHVRNRFVRKRERS